MTAKCETLKMTLGQEGRAASLTTVQKAGIFRKARGGCAIISSRCTSVTSVPKAPATLRVQMQNVGDVFAWNIVGSNSYGLMDKRRVSIFLLADFFEMASALLHEACRPDRICHFF